VQQGREARERTKPGELELDPLALPAFAGRASRSPSLRYIALFVRIPEIGMVSPETCSASFMLMMSGLRCAWIVPVIDAAVEPLVCSLMSAESVLSLAYCRTAASLSSLWLTACQRVLRALCPAC
jgi:hypothetical protein